MHYIQLPGSAGPAGDIVEPRGGVGKPFPAAHRHPRPSMDLWSLRHAQTVQAGCVGTCVVFHSFAAQQHA